MMIQGPVRVVCSLSLLFPLFYSFPFFNSIDRYAREGDFLFVVVVWGGED